MKSSGTKSLESTQSIVDLPANYEEALTLVLTESEVALHGMAFWVARYEDHNKNLPAALREHRELVQDSLSDRRRNISQIIQLVPAIFNDLDDLSPQDRRVYDYARQKHSYTSYPDDVISNMKRSASSRTAGNAMHAALDEPTLKSAQYVYGFTSYPDKVIKNLKRSASSKVAGDIMSSHIDTNRPFSHSQQRHDHDYTQQSENQSQGHSSYHSEDQQRQTQTPQPETEPAQPRSDYDELIDQLQNSQDRQLYTTVCSFPRTEVTRLINTVKALREKDPEITDREIALRYARLSNNSESSTPERAQATQIIMALMGGKVSGKLPF